MDKDDWLGQSHTVSGEFEPMGGKTDGGKQKQKEIEER